MFGKLIYLQFKENILLLKDLLSAWDKGPYQNFKMAQQPEQSSTMEQKIDFIISKVSKIDNIERHLLLLQQDMSVIKSEMKQLDTRMCDIEKSVAYMETDYTELKDAVKKETQRTDSVEKQIKSLKVDQVKNWNVVEVKAQIDYLRA